MGIDTESGSSNEFIGTESDCIADHQESSGGVIATENGSARGQRSAVQTVSDGIFTAKSWYHSVAEKRLFELFSSENVVHFVEMLGNQSIFSIFTRTCQKP